MPVPPPSGTAELLAAGCRAATGKRPDEAALRRLSIYLDELCRWNRRINLVARDTVERWIDLHFTDSLFLADLAREAGELADIGSGAGFPGLCVKCLLPELAVTLIEPRGKRAAFLRQVARKAALADLTVAETRAEGFRPQDKKFSLVVSRGLAAAADFLALASGLCAPGGTAATLKGERIEEELAAFRRCAAAADFDLLAATPYTLPMSGKRRNILIFKKTAS